MTSKKLLSTTPLCALVCACVAALALSACDDKNQDENPADVANLADSASTRPQGQQDHGQQDQGQQESASEAGDDKTNRTSASSPSGATVTQKAPLDASLYLTRADVPGLGRGKARVGELVGKKASPSYGTVRLHRAETDNYGAALQLWKLDEEKAAEEMVLRMREQYLGVDDAPKNAPVRRDKAFLSSRAGITTYVFAAEGESAGYVAALSCGETTCPKGWANVRPLAEKVLARIENPDALQKVQKQRRESAEKGTSRAEEKRKEIREQKMRKKRKEAEKEERD